MPACIFCRIAAGEIPSAVVHQDELCVAFRDIEPRAPVHILIVPRRHVASLADLTAADCALAGHLQLTAARLAAAEGLDGSGYRVVVNCGSDGGQTVDHLHVHLLGGRPLGWPPG
jgi:histidine triad (HIT) family protein